MVRRMRFRKRYNLLPSGYRFGRRLSNLPSAHKLPPFPPLKCRGERRGGEGEDTYITCLLITENTNCSHIAGLCNIVGYIRSRLFKPPIQRKVRWSEVRCWSEVRWRRGVGRSGDGGGGVGSSLVGGSLVGGTAWWEGQPGGRNSLVGGTTW